MKEPSRRIECDVLIIGGGCAALVAALQARKSVEKVVVVCKRKPGRSGNTLVALAGFSAFVPDGDASDTPEQHLQDTLAAGCGINDPSLARVLVEDAGARLMELEEYGVRFERAGGSLVRRRPPGHSRARSINPEGAGEVSTRGLSVTLPLLEAARGRGVVLLSDTSVHRLLVRDGAAGGALALETATGEQVELRAKATVLASGGGGQLFANTNNTADMTGDSYSLALEAGVPLRDMEFVQFYPTVSSWPARTTIQNSVFSEGAVLRNRHGERFMPRYDPVKGDTATRDVMSQAIFHEVQAGDGVEGGVYVDCSAVGWPALESRFPTIAHLFRSYSLDPATQWLVVSPATHFLMGGAWIDTEGRTGVEGLFAAGEAAGGAHGANRLGGNALTEAVVFGARAGDAAAAHARRLTHAPDRHPERSGCHPERREGSHPDLPSPRTGSVALSDVRAELRRSMWEHASIVRTEAGLEHATGALQECLSALPRCRVESAPDVAASLETARMILAARAIVVAALHRLESRGAHRRADHPARDDARWLGSTRLDLAEDSLRISFVPLGATA